MHDLRRDRMGAWTGAWLNRIGDNRASRRAVDRCYRENTPGLSQLLSQTFSIVRSMNTASPSTALWRSNRPGLAFGTRRLIS
jgi:hypothetical protein